MMCVLCKLFAVKHEQKVGTIQREGRSRREAHPEIQTPTVPGFWDDFQYPTPDYTAARSPHQTRAGTQPSAVEVPAVAEPKFDLERTVTYPRSPTCLPLEAVMATAIQLEQDAGFLGDFNYVVPAAAPSYPSPVDYKPTTYPLEGITYRNAQISEDDYWALAQARIQAALGGG